MQSLKERTVKQYVLHKHHLLECSQSESILEVVNDIIALHATSVGTTYLSLFVRMKKFQRKNLDDELYEKRRLLRLRAMRNTLFITSTDLAPILHQAAKPQLLKTATRVLKPDWGIPQLEFNILKEKLRTILKGGGKTLPEIKRALPKEMIRTLELKDGKSVYRMSNLSIALNLLLREGTVLSEKRVGTLRITEANRYVLFKEIYPKLNLESVAIENAEAILVRHYIRAFGPVTQEDIAWWTGFSKTDMKKALAAIEKELLQTRINDSEEEYLMLKTDYEKLLKFKPPKTCSVLLLPYEDPYTKGYKTRNLLIDAEHVKNAYAGGGVQPTILLDGKIVGTWNRSMEEGKGPIKLHLFQSPKKEVVREAFQKAEALAKHMANQKISIEMEYTKSSN